MKASTVINQKAYDLYYRKNGKWLLSYQTAPDSILLQAVVEFLDEMDFDLSKYERKKEDALL